MGKQLLVETQRLTKFTEVDTVEKPKSVLKVITGPVADFIKNRNGRTYSRRLWEKVIDSEYVQEMMDAKSLFGETDHPEERTEIFLKEASHCIRDLWIDEEKEQLWAKIDVLDTNNGRDIANILDYGTKIGVSSRGAGTVSADGVVDPEDYHFFTFDLVARPSVASARPSMVESEKVILSEAQIDEIISQYRSLGDKTDEDSINYYEMVREHLMDNTIKNLVLESEIISRLN